MAVAKTERKTSNKFDGNIFIRSLSDSGMYDARFDMGELIFESGGLDEQSPFVKGALRFAAKQGAADAGAGLADDPETAYARTMKRFSAWADGKWTAVGGGEGIGRTSQLARALSVKLTAEPELAKAFQLDPGDVTPVAAAKKMNEIMDILVEEAKIDDLESEEGKAQATKIRKTAQDQFRAACQAEYNDIVDADLKAKREKAAKEPKPDLNRLAGLLKTV
jgi:hypothetical protein